MKSEQLKNAHHYSNQKINFDDRDKEFTNDVFKRKKKKKNKKSLFIIAR